MIGFRSILKNFFTKEDRHTLKPVEKAVLPRIEIVQVQISEYAARRPKDIFEDNESAKIKITTRLMPPPVALKDFIEISSLGYL